MLDPYIRPLIDPPLNFIGKRLASAGVTANALTLIGFGLGLVAIVLISLAEYPLAFVFICLNRLLDGLDGAVARHNLSNDFGGFLDIVCDFIIYAGIVFSFGLANPNHLLAAAFLIFSFIGPMSSFLAYAILAAKRHITTTDRGIKSFYHLGGLCEGTETMATLLLMCLIPTHFQVICLVFGVLCWFTTIGRIYQAWRDFGPHRLILSADAEPTYTQPVVATKGQGQ
jgi:phosphatidylglycerophosphate synthase